MYRLLFIIGVFNTFISFTSSYGYTMHEYLGKLTDNYLQKFEPSIYNKVIKLFDGESIESVSPWADRVKRNKEYNWTKELHYIDILECGKDRYNKSLIYKYCENSCIVTALQDFTNSIKHNFEHKYTSKDGTELTNVELLKFLFHFMQDFSQPLHLLGYDRGGNSFRVNLYMNGYNKTLNLHTLWDSLLPMYFVEHHVYNFPYTRFTAPDDYYQLIEDVLNINIKDVACKIYPDSHYIIFNDYFKEEYFMTLFDNYHKLMVHTLKYIFE